MKTIVYFVCVDALPALAGAYGGWWLIRRVINPMMDRAEEWICRKLHLPRMLNSALEKRAGRGR